MANVYTQVTATPTKTLNISITPKVLMRPYRQSLHLLTPNNCSFGFHYYRLSSPIGKYSLRLVSGASLTLLLRLGFYKASKEFPGCSTSFLHSGWLELERFATMCKFKSCSACSCPVVFSSSSCSLCALMESHLTDTQFIIYTNKGT